MSRAVLVLAVFLLAAGLSSGGSRAQEVTRASGTVLSGNDLPYPIRLSVTDDDDLRRRINQPPIFEEAPAVDNDFYQVTSSYWDEAIRDGREDEAVVDATADYYEDEGIVRATQAGEDVWLILDLRQQAILHRYLRLGRLGRLPPNPGVLEVLARAYQNEPITVEVEGDRLSSLQRNVFFTGVSIQGRPRFTEAPVSPRGRPGVWLIFTLQEGRSVRVLYDPDAQELIDAFGSEVYVVHQQSAVAIAAANTPGRGPQIVHEAGRGSPVWWAVMIGAGAVALAVAVWVRQRDAA